MMKPTGILAICLLCFLCACKTNNAGKSANEYSFTDSLALVQMVNVRENAMRKKDLATIMAQFSDDATFINAAGYYCADKREIEKFHSGLIQMDSVGYFYKTGGVHVRILDNNNALVYYPWRMDWFAISSPKDTLAKEIGLMTLSAQKRNDAWFWVAITNQHTPDFFNDLTRHKK